MTALSPAQREALATIVALGERYEDNPGAGFAPTPPQEWFFGCAAQIKALIAANQLGKTWAQCKEADWRCSGKHPFLRTHEPPIRAWILCRSWSQSLTIQTKFWEVCDRDEISDDTEFVPGRGFRGKHPLVRYKNGSILHFKTVKQDTLDLASETVHYIGPDEPLPAKVWSEIVARTLRTGGVIGLTFTAVGEVDVSYLKEKADKGEIKVGQFALTPGNTTPRGALRPLLSQEQIDSIAAKYHPWERAQRIEGAWEGMVEGRAFAAFDPATMVGPFTPMGTARVCIGIDYGTDAGSQVAVLAVVTRSAEGHRRVTVLDEEVSDGLTTPEQDAQAILDMLARHGLSYASVDRWTGDRRHGGKRWGGEKSNRLLEEGFARCLGVPVGRLPWRLRTAYKPAYSVWEHIRLLHACMLRSDFYVRPAAEELIRSLKVWDGSDDEYKHVIDALRYAVADELRPRAHVGHKTPAYT